VCERYLTGGNFEGKLHDRDLRKRQPRRWGSPNGPAKAAEGEAQSRKSARKKSSSMGKRVISSRGKGGGTRLKGGSNASARGACDFFQGFSRKSLYPEKG